MGLNISPTKYKSYMNAILDCLQSRKYCETMMDDLLLLHLIKKPHRDKLGDLLKALLKNGLSISLKKCQLCKKELQYVGYYLYKMKEMM